MCTVEVDLSMFIATSLAKLRWYDMFNGLCPILGIFYHFRVYSIYIIIYIYHCILYICYIRRSTPPWIIPSNGCPPDCPSIPHPCSQGTGDSASFAPPKLLDRLVPCLEGNTIGTPPESRDMARNHRACNKSTKPKRINKFINLAYRLYPFVL